METLTESEGIQTPIIEANPILNINVSRIIMGLMEIGNLDIDDFKVNLAISKTITNLATIEIPYQKTTQVLMKKYIKTDENGNLLTLNGFYIFNSESDKNTYQDAIDKLNETPVDVQVWKIKASELQKIKGIKGTALAKISELVIDDVQI